MAPFLMDDFKLEKLKADNSDNCSLLVRPQNIYFEKKNDSDQKFQRKNSK